MARKISLAGGGSRRSKYLRQGAHMVAVLNPRSPHRKVKTRKRSKGVIALKSAKLALKAAKGGKCRLAKSLLSKSAEAIREMTVAGGRDRGMWTASRVKAFAIVDPIYRQVYARCE